jgi:hypothetical protein
MICKKCFKPIANAILGGVNNGVCDSCLPQCPHCHARISSLECVVMPTITCSLYLDGDIDRDADEDYEPEDWQCPKCGENVDSEEFLGDE